MQPAPVPRTRMTAQARREQIIVAARQVFVHSGLAGARTRDLAAAAGVNEALIYRHFASKEELFEAAVAAPLEEAVAALVAREAELPPTSTQPGNAEYARTRAFIGDLLEVMDEIGPLLGVILFGDADRASDYVRDRIAPSLEAVRDVVIGNLPADRRLQFDLELTVYLLFGMTWFVSVADRLQMRRRDRDEVADQITAILLHGVGPRP